MLLFSKTLHLDDYDKFDEHTYFQYLIDSWTNKVPFRYEHEHRKWEYGQALRLLKQEGSKTVLDVGGGSSLLSLGLANLDYDVTQINYDEDNRYVKKQSKFINKNINYIQKDFLEYKGRQKFDAVLCISVIEHVEDDMRFFKKLLSKVKKNGILFLTTDYSAFGERFSDAHLLTYTKEMVEEFIKVALDSNFELVDGIYDYDRYSKAVYDYTFVSLALRKK